MNCENCCFYFPSIDFCFGYCHRNAPSNCGYPIVKEEDMCGDFVPDDDEYEEDE